MTRRSWRTSPLLGLLAALGALAAYDGCVPDLDPTRDQVMRGSFGETLYREACQRVAYTAQLDEQAAGTRATVDVSGATTAATCQMGAPPPMGAPEKLVALTQQRSAVIDAVNAILPQSFLDPLNNFLIAIVGLHDDGTFPDAVAKTGALIGGLRDDDDFTAALARLSGRDGYRPVSVADLVRTVVDYPAIDDFLAKSLTLFLDGSDNPTPEFQALLSAISAELKSTVPLAMPADKTRTLELALGLLYSTNAEFGDGTPRLLTQRDWRGVAQVVSPGGKVPAPFVDNNGDGLADIDGSGRFIGTNGQPVAIGTPFPVLGVKDTAKRDAQGRLVDANGNPVFQYLDLDPTFVGALTRESVTLLDPTKDNALGLVWGTQALLGPRLMQTKSYVDPKTGAMSQLSYNGYATQDAPLLDLMHAFVQVLGDPNADSTLQTAHTLLDQYEDPTTRVIAAMLDAKDRANKHPEATVPATSDIYDDLVPIILRVLHAEPRTVNGKPYTLVEDLMDALEDPHALGLGAIFGAQMKYKDRFILDQNSQTVSGSWSTPVDYTQPDSDYNRSIMQRMAHLVHDANGAKFCNKDGASATVLGVSLGSFAACDMFEIDDIGYFFVLAMADTSITDDSSRPETRNSASFREHVTSGVLHTLILDDGAGDFTIETLTGISGFGRFPTPAAAARSLFLDPQHQSDFLRNSIDPVPCNEGDLFTDVHNDSIFAWEVPVPGNPSSYPNDSFYDAVKPLVNAFARHDECLARDGSGSCTQVRNAAHIFVDLLTALHTHWASSKSTYFGHNFQSQNPNGPRYSTGDGAFTYQPLVSEVLSQGDLVPALIGLSPTLRTMTVDGTPNTPLARPLLVKTIGYLFDPAQAPATLAYRDGTTMAKKSDGVSSAGRVTPYYLLADAFAKKRAALTAAPPAQQGAWNAAASSLVDQILTVTQVQGYHLLKNRNMHGILLALVDFVRGRLDAHTASGDAATWVQHGLDDSIANVVAGPVFAALGDLTAKLEGNQDARTALYSLLSYLVNAAQSDAAFQSTLTALADDAQMFLDDPDLVPIAHAMGNAVAPDQGAVVAGLRMAQRAHRLDPNCPKTPNPNQRCTLTTVLKNLYTPVGTADAPAGAVANVVDEVDRSSPGANAPYSQADYRSILDNASKFLIDEQRGLLRFSAIVQNRNYDPNAQ
jgi:hypothetical protein